jgi:hypothetical protein
MKSYSVKQLYKELSKALKELPFEITHYKKPIAVVVEAEEYEDKYSKMAEESFEEFKENHEKNK